MLNRLLRLLIPLTLSLGHLAAAPVITEFLTDNSSGFQDEDSDFSDWIEIHNPDATPINLAGWHLTDDPTLPTKWTFPSHTLAPNDYLIVFASGKNRAISGSEFHTNFALSRSGGYLALLTPGATVESFFDYPKQATNVSYGPTKTGNELVSLINHRLPRPSCPI